MPPSEIHLVAGVHPNFMKVAPVVHTLEGKDLYRVILVYTGQHDDEEMSEASLRDLGLPTPHVELAASGGSHVEQTERVVIDHELICLERPPDWIIVVGDVNSTLAAALEPMAL